MDLFYYLWRLSSRALAQNERQQTNTVLPLGVLEGGRTTFKATEQGAELFGTMLLDPFTSSPSSLFLSSASDSSSVPH